MLTLFFDNCYLASVSINAFMVLIITGKAQMAKVANDTAAPPEKKSKGKRKNTSGKSGIFFRNYSSSFLSPIHWLVAFQSKASEAVCRKNARMRRNVYSCALNILRHLNLIEISTMYVTFQIYKRRISSPHSFKESKIPPFFIKWSLMFSKMFSFHPFRFRGKSTTCGKYVVIRDDNDLEWRFVSLIWL